MCGHDYDHIDLDNYQPQALKMSTKVTLTKHDGTQLEFDAVGFRSTGTLYVVDTVDGLTVIERVEDIKTVSTELQDELKGQV